MIPWTVARQAPLSMGFSRQEYWSGLPHPPPGDLPNPGIELTPPVSPAVAGRFFTAEPLGKPRVTCRACENRFLGPSSGVSDSGISGMAPGICISNQFTGDASAAGPETAR